MRHRRRFTFSKLAGRCPQGRGRVLEMPDHPQKFAATLYANLHAADAEGLDWLAIEKAAGHAGMGGDFRSAAQSKRADVVAR